MKLPQSQFLENHFENHFWKIFLSLENSLIGYIVKVIFKKKVPEINANFNVFESQI